MDCEAVTDRLIDLLYEELDQPDAEKARAHLAGCESCAAAFDRVSAGRELASMMKMEEPPPAVRVSLLAAARDRVERASKPEAVREQVRAPAREVEREDGGLWGAFVRWLGGFAMGPQVAMATMLLLMVGIGLWYLPELREHDPTDDNAILDPEGEVGPSSSLEPAAPLDLQADPRTGRMVRPSERDEMVRPHVEHPVVQEEAEERVAAEAHEEPAPDPGERQLPRPARAEPQVISEPIADMEAAVAEGDIAPGESLAGQRPAQPQPSVAPPPPPAQFALQQPAPMPERPMPMPPRVNEAEGAGSESSEARYRRGLERYEAHDYRAAADEFDAVVRRPDTDATRFLPSALHHLAQSHRASGDCRRAIAPYEQLLSRYSSYSQASEARLELGECYRRTGRFSDARRVLQEATRDARVASRAQRELAVLETAERAREAAEAEPDEPTSEP